MTALAGWVVPSIALVTSRPSTGWSTRVSASRIPSIGSGVVATFTVARTPPRPSMTTASVLVPPTSIADPMLARLVHDPAFGVDDDRLMTGARRSRRRTRTPAARTRSSIPSWCHSGAHGMPITIDPVAVGDVLGGHRVPGLVVEQADQVGGGDDRLVVDEGDEVLVLDLDPHRPIGAVEVFEDQRRPGEAIGGATVEIDDLAGEELDRPGVVEEPPPRPPLAVLDGLEPAADGGAVREGVLDRVGRHLACGQRVAADRVRQPELDHRRPGQGLRHLVRRRLEDALVCPSRRPRPAVPPAGRPG